jgi:hypothetical protein
MLVKADLSNAEELLPIQHRAFAALYETYQDQYNLLLKLWTIFNQDLHDQIAPTQDCRGRAHSQSV